MSIEEIKIEIIRLWQEIFPETIVKIEDKKAYFLDKNTMEATSMPEEVFFGKDPAISLKIVQMDHEKLVGC